MPQQTVYAGTKAALEGIARVWATELGKKYGITVNCVSPGPTATDMWTECEPEVVLDFQPLSMPHPQPQGWERYQILCPLSREQFNSLEDVVADFIRRFLCSEESRWVTGSTVSASGGMNFI